jgi:hypothetical protein
MLPRQLRLHPSTYQRLARLSQEAERQGAYRVAKRLRAVVLNSEGYTSGELAKLLKRHGPKCPSGSNVIARIESDRAALATYAQERGT